MRVCYAYVMSWGSRGGSLLQRASCQSAIRTRRHVPASSQILQVRAMATAMDVVAICIDWAVAKKIFKADPVEGAWACFSADELQKKFAAGHPYMGVGANLFFLNLKEWAMADQEVSWVEAKAYAQKHFPCDPIVEYYSFLDAKSAAAPPACTALEPTIGWQVPVAVAAMGASLHTATPGPPGQWRKISADSQIYGFLFALATLLRKTPWTKAVAKAIEVFAQAALHLPIDVFPFVLSPQLPKQLFLKSFQIMENVHIAQEDHGSTGWKICCMFNQARQMMDGTKDVNDALADFFDEDVQFAASSEYKMENLKNKWARSA